MAEDLVCEGRQEDEKVEGEYRDPVAWLAVVGGGGRPSVVDRERAERCRRASDRPEADSEDPGAVLSGRSVVVSVTANPTRTSAVTQGAAPNENSALACRPCSAPAAHCEADREWLRRDGGAVLERCEDQGKQG